MSNSKKISKQHALIIYNFKKAQWEVKCLSQKYPIKVNEKTVSFTQKAESIDQTASITIGGEKIFFAKAKPLNMTANRPDVKLEENEMESKETSQEQSILEKREKTGESLEEEMSQRSIKKRIV